MPIIDFHTHVFNNPLKKWAERIPFLPVGSEKISDYVNQIRHQARFIRRPLSEGAHEIQTMLRHLPQIARDHLDFMAGMVPLPGLLIESTASDLLEAMDAAHVDCAVTIAHPPTISNDFMIDLGKQNPRFLPVVNIQKGTLKPGLVLKKYVQRGAKAVKIHPSADGEGVESPRYRALIKAAAETGIPVILHTGCIHAPYLYKNPLQGGAELFTRWFENFKDVKFVLAHMNFHDPNTALDLCEEFPQLSVDTSWQPAEAIGEAVRRIGAERVLFASDWPLVGDNIRIGRKRVEECLDIGLLNEKQTQLILGENAAKLLGMELNAS